MKTSKPWIYALALAVGCTLAVPAYGEEDTSAVTQASQPVFRPPLIKQTSAQTPVPPPAQTTAPQPPPQQVPTSRWDAQEPIQTPEQEGAAPGAATAGPYAACPVDCCYPGCQMIVGIEATFFWPQLSRTFLHTGLDNDLGPTNFINSSAMGSADGALLMGPRFTLGIQGECWGLVGRYWNSSNWANGFVPAIPDSPQAGVQLFDQFNAYTIDLEVQRRFCWR
jgi:hypothetical protein